MSNALIVAACGVHKRLPDFKQVALVNEVLRKKVNKNNHYLSNDSSGTTPLNQHSRVRNQLKIPL